MLRGPCEADVVRWRSELLPLSRSTGISALDSAAKSCRQAGHRFFVSWVPRRRGLGSCLPSRCVAASPRDLKLAAQRLLGVTIRTVVLYTALSPPLLPGAQERQLTAGRVLEGADHGGGPPETEWLRLSLNEVLRGSPLPVRYRKAKTLAFAFREFRGHKDEYFEALHFSIISIFQALTADHCTFVFRGFTTFKHWISESVALQSLERVPFCKSWNAARDMEEAALGIELSIPPMWPIWVPPGLQRNRSIGDVNPSARPAFHVCELDWQEHLSWSVPSDALPAATQLVQRGRCAAATARMLGELGRASLFFYSSDTILWENVLERAMHCINHLDAAFWHLEIQDSGWPTILERAAPHTVADGADGPPALRAFVCVPSRYAIETTGVAGSCSECEQTGAVEQALPLLLAYNSGRFEALSAAPVPRASHVSHGGRAVAQVNEQFTELHAQSVLQRRELRAAAAKQAAQPPQLTAAVCVLGRARTLFEPEVYRSMAENATGSFGANVSVFYALDTNGRPLRDFDEAFELLPPTALALFDSDDVAWGQSTHCPAYRRCGPACFQQFHKFEACLRLIEANEALRRRRFDWVVRLRPDTSWEAPIGALEDVDPTVVHTTMTPNGDPDDNFAMMSRENADVYFGVGLSCPQDRDAYWSTCAIDWAGSHIYPECAIRTKLSEQGVRFKPFPKIYRIHREARCRPGDPRGCGECKIGVCKESLAGGSWKDLSGSGASR